jgi:hypothetical protein
MGGPIHLPLLGEDRGEGGHIEVPHPSPLPEGEGEEAAGEGVYTTHGNAGQVSQRGH